MRCALDDRLAVVAHGDGARGDHLADLGERFALLADGDRADRIDARRVRELRLSRDEADRRLIVGDRIGVRHRAHGGESAGGRRARAGRDRLDFFAPRLAQMAVHVDESGRDDEPGAVDRLETVAIRVSLATRGPIASMRSVDDEHVGDAIDATATDRSRGRRAAGSIGSSLTALRCFRRFGELRLPARQQIEHRHANRDAVRHLIENHAERSVGDVGVDLDAAVHRAGVKNENVALRAVESLARDTEDAIVFAQRRDVAGRHALELEAKNVERIGPLDRFFDAIEHRARPTRRSRSAASDRGPHTPTSAPIFVSPQMFDRATRECSTSPTMQTLRPSSSLEVIAQREHVEQTLRRMLVRAVAGVDDVRLDALGEELRRARRAVANDDHVDAHRLEIARRVDERLALR